MMRLSFVAPGLLGRRLSTASTCLGVVLYRWPASWQASASSSSVRRPAMSTSVLGTVVVGIPLKIQRSIRKDRYVITPSTRCFLVAVTSGAGARPFTSRIRCAAASPLSAARSPHAITAAM